MPGTAKILAPRVNRLKAGPGNSPFIRLCYIGRAMPTQPRISASAMTELSTALEQYCAEVYASHLMPRTQAMYIDNVNNFVRWLKRDFVPGFRKAPYPFRKKIQLDSSSER